MTALFARRGFLAAVAAGAIVAICAKGCGPSPAPRGKGARTVRIGVVAPYEGPNAHIGEMIMNSVRLYFDRHPVEGVGVRLVPVDTKSNPADAVAALQATVPDPDLVGLIAFYHSSTALAGKPIVQEAKVPTLIYSASNPAVTDDAPYYFRLVPTDDNQAVVLADFAKENLKAERVGILYYADEYGRGLSDGIQARARENGLEVVGVESYDSGTTDFRPILSVMKSKDPDVVVICGFVEKSIAILNQAAERGLRAALLAGDGTFNEEQLIQGAGPNAEGLYVAAPYVFDESNAANQEFLTAYREKYGATGESDKPPPWAAFAYDAAGIFAEALGKGHRDRQSIFDHLGGIRSKERAYEGVVGETYFNDRGDAVGRQFGLAVVRDGRFVAVK